MEVADVEKFGAHHYKIGRLRFMLEGEDPVLEPLQSEFRPVVAEGDEAPHLEFRFVTELPPLGQFTSLKPCLVSQKAFEVQKGLRYQVHKDPGALRVYVGPGGWTPRAPVVYHRAKHWNYHSPAEERAKNFMYTLFDWTSQVAQAPLGQSYVHASSLERDEDGLLVTAWGGIGKTTTALKLIMEDGWRFLSDDLAVVDDDRQVHRVPKKMQVYEYNLEGQERLRKRLMAGRSLVDRASWEWFKRSNGPAGVRRRVSAEQLLGSEAMGKTAQISTIVHMERYSGRTFSSRKIGLDSLIDRCVNTLVDELSPFESVSTAVNSAGVKDLMPTIQRLQTDAKTVYRKAFAGAELHLLQVPLDTGPDALVEKVREIVG